MAQILHMDLISFLSCVHYLCCLREWQDILLGISFPLCEFIRTTRDRKFWISIGYSKEVNCQMWFLVLSRLKLLFTFVCLRGVFRNFQHFVFGLSEVSVICLVRYFCINCSVFALNMVRWYSSSTPLWCSVRGDIRFSHTYAYIWAVIIC